MALNVYCEYDARYPLGYHAFVDSLIRTSTISVAVSPVLRRSADQQICGNRSDPVAKEGFTFTRFLVPWANRWEGIALFVDGADMFMRGDIAGLMNEALDLAGGGRDLPAVTAVRHPGYTPGADSKTEGVASSVMLFNCEHPHCRRLGAGDVANQPEAHLHRFEWTDSIGVLAPQWNALVDEPDWMARHDQLVPKLVHFTRGSPAITGAAGRDSGLRNSYREEWLKLAVNLGNLPKSRAR